MRILFVSEFDRCRGPMARAIAERLARKDDLDAMVFDSAGLNVLQSDSPTIEAAAFLRREKFNILNHRSKPLGEELADGADIIFCMTAAQTAETKKRLGEYYAPKVILLNEGIDLATSKMDIEPPGETQAGMRRLYASLSAAMGRLIRTLEDPAVVPEYFGVKSVAPRMKAGTAGAGPRATASSLDPEKRRFLANVIFDMLERSFEPHTTSLLLSDLKALGHELPQFEVEEIMKQDLHGSIRQDRDGVWHVVSGARENRREKAKAEARARAQGPKAEQANGQQEERKTQRPGPAKRMADAEAYEILGLTAESSVADARSKYRALLKRYHPDKFHDDDEFRTLAEEKAKRINEAWNLLKDRFKNEDETVVEEV